MTNEKYKIFQLGIAFLVLPFGMNQSHENSELIGGSNMAFKRIEIGVGCVIIILCPSNLIGNRCPESSYDDFPTLML